MLTDKDKVELLSKIAREKQDYADSLIEALRKINGIVADYLSHDFPASVEEMTVEFTEVVEEIHAVTSPIVEGLDYE